MDASSALRIYLPRYNKVKILVLKYSSPLKLANGAHFRVCNVCSKRLPADLNDQHSKHLKLHQPHWNHYLKMMAKALTESDIIRHIPDEKQSQHEELSSSSEFEEDVFNVLNATVCNTLVLNHHDGQLLNISL